MNKEIIVNFWHGTPLPDNRKNKAFLDKINAITVMHPDGVNDRRFIGTIQEFADKWDDKFLVLRGPTEWVICITQYGNFGQR